MLAALLASLALVVAAPQGSPSSTTLTAGGADAAYPAPSADAGPIVQLHPNGNVKKCVDVAGGKFTDGTPVQIYDCNDKAPQRWSLARGDGTVKLTGTNYCLDAGSAYPPNMTDTDASNGAQTHIAACNGGATQRWFYTDDDRIALTVCATRRR